MTDLPLDVEEDLKRYGVVLADKSDSLMMRALAAVLWPLLGPAFMESFFTTIRFPLCRPRIYCPRSGPVARASRFAQVLRHELVHVRQFAPWYGPAWVALQYLLVPLPFGLSGRWFIERDAYVVDIEHLIGRGHPASRAIDIAVEQLWGAYGWPWPRAWMRRWFETKVLL